MATTAGAAATDETGKLIAVIGDEVSHPTYHEEQSISGDSDGRMFGEMITGYGGGLFACWCWSPKCRGSELLGRQLRYVH